MSKPIKEILNFQYIPYDVNDDLNEIFKNEDSIIYAMYAAYNYGVIQGIRAGRVKRKRSNNA